MLIYKVILGVLATAVGAAAYSIYIRTIIKGETKPHPFSWLLWGFLTGIICVAQIIKGGGAGAWAIGVSSGFCFTIGILALSKDNRGFSRFDWVFLGAAVLALVLWIITKTPVLSVILITLVDTLGYASTLRKGYLYPHEERITSFLMNSLKYFISILALQSYSLVTWLYPLVMIVTNGSVALLVALRRRFKVKIRI